MSTYNVLVTVPRPLRDYILSEEAERKLRRLANVTTNQDGRNWTGEELAARLPGVDAILASWGLVKLTAEVLKNANNLEIVAYAAGSVKGFVTPALYERGIVVSHAAHRIADSVAEFSLVLAMIGLRRPHEFDRQLKAGAEWSRSRDLPLYEMAGKRVGLLGMGYVGRRAARLFQGVSAQVWAYDPYLPADQAEWLGVHKAELDDLLSTCKIVSVHLPTTEETHHMLGAREFALLRDGAIFINTARSWVLDQEALVRELQKGRFWAALDVYDEEPLPVNHPLRSMDNVFLTPHVAGLTRDSHGSLMGEMVDEIARYFAGEPLKHQVTQEMLKIMA
ncbi:MAG: hydroxyacid dehydrogenase [Chloroflexota bacterium]|nr:hydroxyacid dehydrogenase [Chloroflexota bacterium]